MKAQRGNIVAHLKVKDLFIKPTLLTKILDELKANRTIILDMKTYLYRGKD